MNKWHVKVTFCMNDISPVEFVVDDFDSVLSVLRVIKFKQEVFRIEFWQNRELGAALGIAPGNMGYDPSKSEFRKS